VNSLYVAKHIKLREVISDVACW